MPGVPGIFTDEHKAGWKRVVDAVHPKGSVFVMQRKYNHFIVDLGTEFRYYDKSGIKAGTRILLQLECVLSPLLMFLSPVPSSVWELETLLVWIGKSLKL